MTAFLSRAEVAELTGCARKAGQVAWLNRQAREGRPIRHWINAAGWPVIPRSAIDGLPTPAQDGRPKWSPKAA